MADNWGNVQNGLVSGFEIGQKVGGKYTGLQAGLDVILKRLQEKKDLEDKKNLLGQEGLMKGTIAPVDTPEGQPATFNIPNMEGKFKSITQQSTLLDENGNVVKAIPKNSKFVPGAAATKKSEDVKVMADSYAADVASRKQTYDPKAIPSYGSNKAIYSDALRKQGLDIGQLDLNYQAMSSEVKSLNGTVQTRLRQAIGTVKQTLPMLRDTARKLNEQGISFSNMVDLKSKLNNLQPDQKNAAVAYMTQLTTIQDELGVTLQSGGVPTDMAKQMAKDIFNPFYTADQMDTAITQVGANIDVRDNVVNTTKPILLNAGGQTGYKSIKAQTQDNNSNDPLGLR